MESEASIRCLYINDMSTRRAAGLPLPGYKHGYFAAPFTNSNAFRTAMKMPECEICFVNELNHPPSMWS